LLRRFGLTRVDVVPPKMMTTSSSPGFREY
jgi:hypothetical protein